MIKKLKISHSQIINRNVLLLLFFIQFVSCSLYAQEYQRHELIGAYVYNLTKNMQWENEENIPEFHFLILSSDQKIIDEFRKLARIKTLRNKPIEITASESLASPEQFQLIFLSKENEELLPGIFDKIEGKNILLISNGYADKRLIMINFIEKEDKKIQFEINKANIINQNLSIMPDVVLLGGTEIDVAKLYKESQVSLRSMQKEMDKLENDLSNLQKLIDSRNREITRQQEIINKQAEEFSVQQKQLKDQRAELQRLFQSVKNQQDTLKNKAILLEQRERELSEKSKQIKKSDEVLIDQLLSIREYTARIKTQQKTIEEQGVMISTQQNRIYVLGIITVLILVLIITIYRGYKIKQKTNKILEAEITVRKRTEATLNKRTEELSQSNKELEAFSYSVSHDLRTPLRSINGFSQILLSDHQNKFDDASINYLQRINTATQRMAQLIDDMLSLSKISRREMSIQEVNLSELASEISTNLMEDQPERKVKFIFQEDIKTNGDRGLLRIVLENLLANAWKFTSKHAAATIEFGTLQQGNQNVCFVRDNGAGFDMKYADKLFGTFQRLHDSDEFPGTGIGLATVQRIISRHGGKVWAEGKVEKGATFYFTIL